MVLSLAGLCSLTGPLASLIYLTPPGGCFSKYLSSARAPRASLTTEKLPGPSPRNPWACTSGAGWADPQEGTAFKVRLTPADLESFLGLP